MSEYQYYEFRAVDRPLSDKQMDELRAYSTRAHITPSSFTNVYNWGNFKGDPDRWVEKYFDAFLYMANWGTRRLMLRLPKRLLDPDTASLYCVEDNLSCRVKDDNLILSFYREDVEDYEWVEGEGWLDSLLPLRSDLMQGDHRSLYLGWLLAVQEGLADFEEDEEEKIIEPPVPPGLADLNAPLQCLVDFLGIDHDLAEMKDKSSEFSSRMSALCKKHARKPTLLDRFQKAKLLD